MSKVLFVGVLVPGGVLSFTPYEPFLEGVIALIIVAAALAGPLRGSGRPMWVLWLGVNPVVIYERWACLLF
jgi:hypothetical protein